MTAHRLEVADVFHAHQKQFLQRWGHVISDEQRKVLRDIGRCRTVALATHLERCDRCDYETVAYDSCRNRHCPKCQSSARDRWLMKQASSLLPVPYVHVVFTVPEQLAPLTLSNQRLFYNLLFRAASETLLEIAAEPRHFLLPASRPACWLRQDPRLWSARQPQPPSGPRLVRDPSPRHPPDMSALLTEPQKSALNRFCSQCKRGTLHLVPQHFSVEQGSPNSPHACAHFDLS